MHRHLVRAVLVGICAGVAGLRLQQMVRDQFWRRRQRVFYAGYAAGVEDMQDGGAATEEDPPAEPL